MKKLLSEKEIKNKIAEWTNKDEIYLSDYMLNGEVIEAENSAVVTLYNNEYCGNQIKIIKVEAVCRDMDYQITETRLYGYDIIFNDIVTEYLTPLDWKEVETSVKESIKFAVENSNLTEEDKELFISEYDYEDWMVDFVRCETDDEYWDSDMWSEDSDEKINAEIGKVWDEYWEEIKDNEYEEFLSRFENDETLKKEFQEIIDDIYKEGRCCYDVNFIHRNFENDVKHNRTRGSFDNYLGEIIVTDYDIDRNMARRVATRIESSEL